jgi:L-asparaginase/Glu-tRNA(Gln) amidotransferase subunit D
MGTDTMAFAASALSFMLENLGKAVVFTGSQIPFSEAYNDARRNLIVSCIFAASEDSPPEVSNVLLLHLSVHTLFGVAARWDDALQLTSEQCRILDVMRASSASIR